ncbi:hypothetical protein BT96DRAFT_993448 [Gymnopus androsaceus JB14]|uniref:HNH nuclease domain-containing protein n=1 Tax=Gymnopus androsaceus JB14 TaxID=1447944 RepID=A0A6A4HM30_9AGAR|nr:hypothetical protein BT96DRAFT_993448 [Gymnopus androsaceus JB14]
MVSYDKPVLPEPGSPDIQDFSESYSSCYNLILVAERNAVSAYATNKDESAKQNIICARVTGGFLIHLYGKRNILGDGPASELVRQVLSGPKPSDVVVYKVGRMLRDHLIHPFRSEKKPPAPPSARPSRPDFTRVEDMLAQTVEASGTDYQTSRKKALARDGYRARNLCREIKGSEAPVQTCHILDKATLQGLEDPSEDGGEITPMLCMSLLTILKQFHLSHSVDVLLKKGGVYSPRNILSLIQPLHHAFHSLDLWFDQTDEDDTYVVQVSRDRILTGYTNVNRRPHFTVNEAFKKPRFKDVLLELPDPGLLALHAVCARVAHMSGAAEYFHELERDAEDTMVVTEDSLHLLNNLLSPFAVVSAY